MGSWESSHAKVKLIIFSLKSGDHYKYKVLKLFSQYVSSQD